jgi:hypothetical protein
MSDENGYFYRSVLINPDAVNVSGFLPQDLVHAEVAIGLDGIVLKDRYNILPLQLDVNTLMQILRDCEEIDFVHTPTVQKS